MKHLQHPALPRVCFGFILGLLFIAISRPIWNIDLFWHVAAGRWIVEHHVLPTTDIFSALNPERDWITFQWLYEWLVYQLEQWGGLSLIRLTHGILLLGAFTLLFRSARELTGSAWAAVATCAMTLAVYDVRIRVRPHILILLAVVVLLPVLFGQWRTKSLKHNVVLWGLPIALLANLHAGGALILLAILIAIPAGEWLACVGSNPKEPQRKTAIQASGLWVFSCLIAAVMPHFVRGTIHAISMLGASESGTKEWHPAWTWITLFQDFLSQDQLIPSYLFIGILPFAILLVFLVLMGRSLQLNGLAQTMQRVHPTEVLLVIGCSAIAIRYGRFVWLMALPFMVLLRFQRPAWSSNRGTAFVAIMAISLTLLCAHGIRTTNQQVFREGLIPSADELSLEIESSKFPVLSVQFMEKADLVGNVWTPPGWGGYVLWKRHPLNRVSSDGRGNFDVDEARDIKLISRVFSPDDRPSFQELQGFYQRHEELDMLLLPLPPNGFPPSAAPPSTKWQRVFPPPPAWLAELGLPFTKDHQYGQALYVRTNDSNRENIRRAKSIYAESAERIRGNEPQVPGRN